MSVTLRRMRRGRPLERTLDAVASTALVAILALTVATIVLRWLGGSGLRGSLEASEVLVATVAAVGLAGAERAGAHISTDVLVARIPERWAALLVRLGQLCAVIIVSLLAYALVRDALDSYDVREFHYGHPDLPIWPAKALIAVGVVAFLLSRVAQLTRPVVIDETGLPGDAPL